MKTNWAYLSLEKKNEHNNDNINYINIRNSEMYLFINRNLQSVTLTTNDGMSY